MQLFIVAAIAVATIAYNGLLPEILQFPLPLVGAVIVTSAMLFLLVKN